MKSAAQALDDLDAEGFGYWLQEAQAAILRRDAEIVRLREAPSYCPNWAGVLTLDPIPGLDPGIAPWVEILRAHRVETFESCQGGPDPERPDRGHAYPEPTVAFHGGPSAGVHAYHVARQHGLPVGAVRRVWKEVDHELTGPVWEIVFTRQATAQEGADAEAVLAFERGET